MLNILMCFLALKLYNVSDADLVRNYSTGFSIIYMKCKKIRLPSILFNNLYVCSFNPITKKNINHLV